MGWLWSSNPSTEANNNASSTPTPTLTPIPQSSPPTPPPAAPLAREEPADKELRAFLDLLEADAQPSSARYSRVPKNLPPPSSSSQFPSSSSPSSSEPLSEQLLPITMSCRNAFDAAFYCNSLGGQFNNLYRYGEVRSCSENWNDFWFCMRTRTFAAPQKEAAIRERYREKESMRYARREGEELGRDWSPRSSEDVWRSREGKVEWGTAFAVPYEGFEGDDGEWNRKERERRKNSGTMSS